MPDSYVDTSALVKLYVLEVGSVWMRVTILPYAIVISALAIAEIGATLARRVREGTLAPQQARLVWRRFRRDCRTFTILDVDQRTLVRAAALVVRSSVPLRTLDAIHLQAALDAAARLTARSLPRPTVVTADARLELAAQALGFATDNPLNHP